MANRRELVLAIVSDASQFNKGFDQATRTTKNFAGQADRAARGGIGALNTRVSAVTTSLGGLAASAGALAAGQKIVQFAQDSVRAATDLNESINAVNVTFGAAADDVLEIGKNAADSFGLAQSEFNSFAVQFSSFASTIAEGTGGNVSSVIEDLTGRIADFASVMNIDVADAAQKFQSGLAGETESLRRFGIDVSAAAVNTKALELGLADSSAELTEQDKILARYELIMEQTNTTAGDFANTQDELANATRRTNANLEDAKAKIGTAVLPVLGDMASVLADVLGWMNDLSVTLPRTGEEFTALEGVTKSLLGVFGTASIIRDAWTGFFGDASEAQKEHMAVTEESIGAANRHRGSMHDVVDAIEDVGEAGEGLETPDYWHETQEAADDATASIESHITAFRRLTDPVFRAISDQNRLADALEHYREVAGSSESTTRDVEGALFDLLAAQQAANESGSQLPETMNRSEQALGLLGEQLELTDEDLRVVEETLSRLNGQTFSSTYELLFDIPSLPSSGVRSGIRQTFHSGGVVPGPRGSDQLILAAGGETILPTHQPGFSMAAVSGGGVVHNYHFHGDVYGDDGFNRRVREANVQNGRLGLN